MLLLHLNEEGGAIAYDASANNNNGTIFKTSVTGGRFGKARRFDSQNVISIPHSLFVNIGGSDFTIESWIKTKPPTSGFYVFTKSDGTKGFELKVIQSGKLRFYAADALGKNSEIISTRQVDDLEWHLVAAERTGSQVVLYVDGVRDAAVDVSALSSFRTNSAITIGAGWGANEDFSIDEYRLSNKARAPEEFNLQLPPSKLLLSLSGSAVDLSWQNGGGAVGLLRYKIYRGSDSTNVSLIDSTTSTSYINAGLSPATTYYYRVSAVDSTGFEGAKSYAAKAQTGTAGSAPTVMSNTATNVGTAGATLNGTVNPNGLSTTACFEWGMNSTLSTYDTTSLQSVGSGTSAVTLTANLTGLSSNTTYYYRAVGQNAVGTQRGSITSFRTYPSLPVLSTPSNGSSGLPSTVTMSWSTVSGVTYHLQVSTASSFAQAIVLDDSSLASSSRQISSLAENTTYYWRVRAKNSAGYGGWSSPFSFTTVTSKTVTSPGIAFPASPTLSTDYRLVSFPGTGGLSVGEILNGSQNTDWRIFRDNGGSIPNHLTELSASSSLSVGEGYWLLKKGPFNFSQTVTMPQLSGDGTYTINLRTGWNIIGNPFDVPVPWDRVRSYNSLPSNKPLSSYEGSTTFQSVSTLEPFKGYYFNSSSTSLKIPYPFPSLKIDPWPELPIDWQLQLVLETDINSDSENHIGIAPSARIDLDELDQPKPPLMFDQGFLYFSRPSWDSQYGIFNSDFRPSLGDGQVWDFEVSNPRKSVCRIRFIGIEKIPAEYNVILLNERNSTRVNLRENATYEFQPLAERTPFKLLVGKKAFVEDQITLLVPKEFELSQNFPNPFNPSTTITYKVPRDAVVRLEVLSVLGQAVSILAEGSHAPGVYTVTWNASDGAHSGVSSGVYFCRLFVDGKPTRTIKMTLLH